MKTIHWLPEPIRETWANGTRSRYWKTQCGSYRVYRLRSPSGTVTFGACRRAGKDSWLSIEADSLGPGYPKYYDTMEPALKAVLRHAEKATGNQTTDNSVDVFGKYLKNHESETDTMATATLKVNETAARQMLKDLGFRHTEPATCSPKKLERRLNALLDNLGDVTEPEGESKKLFDEVVAALKDGQVIGLEGNGEEKKASNKKGTNVSTTKTKDAAKGSTKAGKGSKNAKGSTKTGGKGSPEKEKVKTERAPRETHHEVDKFGFRADTSGTRITSVLASGKAFTVEHIAEKADVTKARVFDFFASIKKRGFSVVKEEGGKYKVSK